MEPYMTYLNALGSVIAVHGLYGNSRETWTTTSQGHPPGRNWLINDVHHRYPEARILTFGYNLNVVRDGIAALTAKSLQLLDELVTLQNQSCLVRLTKWYC